MHGSPVLWNHPAAGPLVYLWSEEGKVTAFRFLGSQFDTQPFSKGSFQVPDGMPGAMLYVGADFAAVGGLSAMQAVKILKRHMKPDVLPILKLDRPTVLIDPQTERVL